MEIARLGQRLFSHAHQAASFAQACAAAIRAIIIDHYFLQILFHPIVAVALLAIPTVVSFDLRNDSLEGHLFARVLLALAGAGWHQNLDLLAFASVEDQVLNGIRQFAKRCIKAESVMLSQTVEPTPAPGVFVMIKGFLHNGAVAQTPARVGHKERGMHPL